MAKATKKEREEIDILDSVLSSEREEYDFDPLEGLSEEDLANRREVLMVFHYDPFEKENLSDRKKMYRYVTTMKTPDLATDLPKQRGCLDLVRSYLRADKIAEAIQELTKDVDTMINNDKKLKTLQDFQKTTSDIIQKNLKDFGYSERYSLSSSKGVGTLSHVVKEADALHWDDGNVNLYDVKTSKSMQLQSDISGESIMKQIALNAGDFKDIVQKQRDEIERLNKENLKLSEENRLIREKITKQELLKELATDLEAKGLGMEEITDMVLAEIHYDDSKIKEMKKRSKK